MSIIPSSGQTPFSTKSLCVRQCRYTVTAACRAVHHAACDYGHATWPQVGSSKITALCAKRRTVSLWPMRRYLNRILSDIRRNAAAQTVHTHPHKVRLVQRLAELGAAEVIGLDAPGTPVLVGMLSVEGVDIKVVDARAAVQVMQRCPLAQRHAQHLLGIQRKTLAQP